MIKLVNAPSGTVVLAFKGRKDYNNGDIENAGAWHGTVLAQTPREYATWRVSSFDGGETWDTYSGCYPNPQVISDEAYIMALENFNTR